MKNRFLFGALFALLLGVLLGASNIPQGWTWNSTLNAFSVLMKDGGGTKFVPGYESYSAPVTFGGGAYSSGANMVQMNMTKTGKAVTLCLKGIFTITMSATTNILTGSVIPVSMRPANNLYAITSVASNGVVSAGVAAFSSNGLIRIYYGVNETTNWPAAGISGWEPFCVTFSIDQ